MDAINFQNFPYVGCVSTLFNEDVLLYYNQHTNSYGYISFDRIIAAEVMN